MAFCAARAGLTGDRLDDFVIAVNELLTNAVRHGGGHGHVALWRAAGAVVCEVTDRGSGFKAPRPDEDERPQLHKPGGWGLWLAGRLTDTLDLESDAQGTTVRISTRVS